MKIDRVYTSPNYAGRIFQFGLLMIAFFVFLPLWPQPFLLSLDQPNPFSQGFGESQSLAPSIIGMKQMLSENQFSEFALSPKLDQDGYTHMRAIEFLYPIKNQQNSPILLAAKGELVDVKCKMLNVINNIVLYDCR